MLRKLLPGTLLLTTTLVVCAVVGELTVRLLYPRVSNYNMEMWRYASEIKQPTADPELPFHHAPNRAGGFYGAEIRTNSFGFRDREYPIERTRGKNRVLFIGDSFTLGWGVPFDSIYSKRVEAGLNRAGSPSEVINLGIGNYNTAMELELLKRKGLQFDPDLIVLMHFVNDAEPTPEPVGKFKAAVLTRSYLFAFLFDQYAKVKPLFDRDFNWKAYYSALYEPDAPGFVENMEALDELIALAHRERIGLLVALIPSLRELEEYPFPEVPTAVRAVADPAGVPVVDLLPILAPEDPASLWVTPEDPHANSKANRLIADALFEVITEGDLLERRGERRGVLSFDRGPFPVPPRQGSRTPPR